ncbi:MAG: hypothetical protein HYT29_02365 [Parcubacteria group bacterium]|nr:hypothetical protein [Parcubacteria group bacterium]
MKKGRFIVLEGTDGSGKTTQFKKLVARLRRVGSPRSTRAEAGFKVATFDFPQYGKESSYFVREYLNGRYGGLEEVGPYRASIFYALDRFDVGPKIKKWLNEGRIVVSNRYVASNMGHQGAKIKGTRTRQKYFKWLDELEYGILGIPRPDLNIVLHIPARVAQRLVDKKSGRKYVGGKKRDLHEADLGHLKRAEQTYLQMAKTFPKDFALVRCVEKGKLLSVEEIQEKVLNIARSVLGFR